jgi:hypothetical protein
VIIEFELQGSKCLHKGIFDTDGFWVKFEPQIEEIQNVPEVGMVTLEQIVTGWKLYSHFSFSFFHEDKEIVNLVYARLISVLRGSNNVEMENIGYFRKINK